MKNLIKLKPSTGLDTDTKKINRWFRIGSQRGEIDQLFDLYWGGPERRITGLTLRILGLNFVALICLLAGVFSLGKYQSILIRSKLDIFETEIFLLAAALSEGNLKKISSNDLERKDIYQKELNIMTAKLSATLDKRILVFDHKGKLSVDSNNLSEKNEIGPLFRLNMEDNKRRMESIEILKSIAAFMVSLTASDNIPPYSNVNSPFVSDYYDANEAMKQKLSASAWRDKNGNIILTAAMPVIRQGEFIGVVMLFSEGRDINQAMGDAWFDIVKIFFVTLLITIFLSVYLSGVIARPLRKLAKAAENVRKGKLKYTEIPDMSDRNDEIGELSIVLRDMTYALWERMDGIEAFAADVAHEIKNPLSSLKSAVETALIVKKKEDLHKLLGVIQHDVERLDRLITDISHASRLDAELSREYFERVDIKQTLRNLINVYKSPLDRDYNTLTNTDQAEKNGVKIRLSLPEEDNVYVFGSEGRLIQVFQNIIANALSFSPSQGSIFVTVEYKANRVTIYFEDEGPGIPENKLKTIFERFYSERPQHEDYGRHSGLGLSICKQIITAHNGVIFAENRKDDAQKRTGARFVVILNGSQ